MHATHHHNWKPHDSMYRCAECAETSPACCDCHKPTATSLHICDRCLQHQRHVLDDIKDALSHYQPTPRTYLHATRYDIDRIKGRTTSDRPNRVTVHHIPTILQSWATMWAEAIGETPHPNPHIYLPSRFIWAAHNHEASAWPDYTREIRALRHIARQAAGLTPKHHQTPCTYCGGTIVQDWATRQWQPRPDGLTTTYRCTKCHREWPNLDAIRFINRQHLQALPLHHPDTPITLQDAPTIWPQIPAATWRQWKQRGTLKPDSYNHRGQALYRIATIEKRVQQWHTETRGHPNHNKHN